MVRLQAALALGKVGVSSGIPVAAALLSHSDPGVRQEAAGVLAITADPKTGLAALEGAAKTEKDPAVLGALSAAASQVRARFGIPEPAPPAPPAPKAPAAAKAATAPGKAPAKALSKPAPTKPPVKTAPPPKTSPKKVPKK